MKRFLAIIILFAGCAAHAQPISQSMYCKFWGRFHVKRCGSGWWMFRGGGIGNYVPASGASIQFTNATGAPATVPVTTTRSSNESCIDASGTLTTVSNNKPCVESNGLLVENGATNLILQSGDLGNAAWSATAAVGLTVTSNQGVAPDGTTTAADVNFSSPIGSGSTGMVSQGFTATAAEYGVSIYLKGVSTSGSVWLGLNNGVTFYQTSCSYTSSSYSRCSLVSTANLTAATWTFTLGQNGADGAQTGIAAQEFFATFAQAETQPTAGASPYISTYIPTTGSTATRANDNYTFTNPLTDLNNFCLGTTAQDQPTGSASAQNAGFYIVLGVAFTANAIFNNMGGALTPRMDVYDSAVADKNITKNAIALGTYVQHCGSNGTLSMYSNGVKVSSPNIAGTGTGVVSAMNSGHIGSQGGSNTFANRHFTDLCMSEFYDGCKK